MSFNVPSNFVGSRALNAQETGDIHIVKLWSNSPSYNTTEGIGNLFALLNVFLPNLEMILILRWLNFTQLFTHIFASWKYYSSWVIYEKVVLDSKTSFFFSVQRTKYTFFSPLGKFYLTPHHHHSTLMHKTETYSTVRHSRGTNVQSINGRLFIRYNCLLIRRESSFPLILS